MRAWPRLCSWSCVWPALGNMTRRKLRGQGETYGESVKQAQFSKPTLLNQGHEFDLFWC
jgi:hypothetical protein